MADLEVVRRRLERCQAKAGSDSAVASQVADLAARVGRAAKLRQRTLERDADLIDQTAALVFGIEALPSTLCGADSADDQALQLVADRNRAHVQ